MPRLTPAAIYQASRISRHLPLLLRECRDLHSARNELRWLIEFVAETNRLSSPLLNASVVTGPESARHRKRRHNETRLDHLVRRRSKGEPLQYILGSQPFGDLDILCRPNVLIPRPETETYTSEVAKIWQELNHLDRGRTLGIADFCCGTGCISLLLHSLLRSPQSSDRIIVPLRIRGYDVSEHALNLAQKNLEHNLRLQTLHASAAENVRYEKLDLLALSQQPKDAIVDRLHHRGQQSSAEPPFDIVVSNPPYISPEDYAIGGRTTKSVRMYEPELALVPPSATFDGVNRADQFYTALLRVVSAIKPKLLVMEVGDVEQAIRVRELCRKHLSDTHELKNGKERHKPLIEIWRDDGTVVPHDQEASDKASSLTTKTDRPTSSSRHTSVDVVDCRAVVLWLDDEWIEFRRQKMKMS